MTRRYLFWSPDITKAAGGVAVIYDLVALLRRNGLDCALLHNSPSGCYPDHPQDLPKFWTGAFDRIYGRYQPRRSRLGYYLKTRRRVRLAGPNPRYVARPEDVIVMPELFLAEALEAFPGQTLCILVQNPFLLMESYQRAVERGLDPARSVRAYLSTSEVCHTHLDLIEAETVLKFPVSMKPEEIGFVPMPDKERLITYMPRKRPEEARQIVEMLEKRGKLQGYRLEAIDGIPRAQVIDKLRKSRFFISLMRRESLGFPAAEAMAAGAVAIGYDGLGAAEYFDRSTGFPIPEGDFAGMVLTVEQQIAAFEENPKVFDVLCARACARIHERYSQTYFETNALRVWRELDAIL
ncbi:hypothetical protein RPE78_17230 (plasmid) [Thioclava litoralis]|uniref:Glycosyl transferases group 1 n=1 Tax=Thioclava litoralis TaxID=3076557 RepID=A0ABZ1E3J2_9RHOB|nr:hypothetical protein RPE78_17230 [Thioclava sp. FTW29]